MVDINNINNTVDKFEDIDSKITIRLTKEKRSITSYISGLNKFMNDDEITNFLNIMKKKLGTRAVEREIQENKKSFKIYGFGGDHRENIKEHLIKSGIDEDKINVKM